MVETVGLSRALALEDALVEVLACWAGVRFLADRSIGVDGADLGDISPLANLDGVRFLTILFGVTGAVL